MVLYFVSTVSDEESGTPAPTDANSEDGFADQAMKEAQETAINGNTHEPQETAINGNADEPQMENGESLYLNTPNAPKDYEEAIYSNGIEEDSIYQNAPN